MKMFLIFLTITIGYTLLYTGYAYAAKTMHGRIVYVSAVVIGTLLGSSLGEKLFG